MEKRYSCPTCKGTNVQFSFPVWIDANDLDNREEWEPDWEADTGDKCSDKGFCVDCNDTILVDDAGEDYETAVVCVRCNAVLDKEDAIPGEGEGSNGKGSFRCAPCHENWEAGA